MMLANKYKDGLDNLKARRFFSPDLKELEEYPNHLFFIWDSFKLKFPSEAFLKGVDFLGEGHTLEDNFVMKICPTMPMIYQVRLDEKNGVNATRVWGEVYALKVHDILRMDAVMDNLGSFYRRKRYIVLNDQQWPGNQPERKVTVEAWVYIATDTFKVEMARNMAFGTQTKVGGKCYWEWRHSNMRPTN